MTITILPDRSLLHALTELTEYLKNTPEANDYFDNPIVINVDVAASDEDKEQTKDRALVVCHDCVIDTSADYVEAAKNRCVETMRARAAEGIEYFKNIDQRIKKAETYLKAAKTKGASTIADWEYRLSLLREGKENAPQELALLHNIQTCIDEGRVTWEITGSQVSSLGRKLLLKLIPIIDKDCTVLEEPFYFICPPRGGLFSNDVDYPGGYWYVEEVDPDAT